MHIVCFFYPLISLNRVRICAGGPFSAPRDLQKQDCDCKILVLCYSTHKKNLDIARNPVNTRFLVICLRCHTVCIVMIVYIV